jgi:hypothetical protein
MFSPIDYGYMFNLQFNWNIAKKWGLTLGGRFDRSFTDAERKRFFTTMSQQDYNNYTSTHAVEDNFPVSTKKRTVPARDDFFTRNPSKNSTVGGFLAVYYRF